MYYTYKGKSNKLFKHNKKYKFYYIDKYNCFICSNNLKILKPEELKSNFSVSSYSYIIYKKKKDVV